MRGLESCQKDEIRKELEEEELGWGRGRLLAEEGGLALEHWKREEKEDDL